MIDEISVRDVKSSTSDDTDILCNLPCNFFSVNSEDSVYSIDARDTVNTTAAQFTRAKDNSNYCLTTDSNDFITRSLADCKIIEEISEHFIGVGLVSKPNQNDLPYINRIHDNVDISTISLQASGTENLSDQNDIASKYLIKKPRSSVEISLQNDAHIKDPLCCIANPVEALMIPHGSQMMCKGYSSTQDITSAGIVVDYDMSQNNIDSLSSLGVLKSSEHNLISSRPFCSVCTADSEDDFTKPSAILNNKITSFAKSNQDIKGMETVPFECPLHFKKWQETVSDISNPSKTDIFKSQEEANEEWLKFKSRPLRPVNVMRGLEVYQNSQSNIVHNDENNPIVTDNSYWKCCTANDNEALTGTCECKFPHRQISRSKLFELDRKIIQDAHTERIRREHCEREISKLQGNILNLEQKLTVAANLDKKKTTVISELREAWERLACNWEKIDFERNQAHKRLTEDRKRFDDEKQSILRDCQQLNMRLEEKDLLIQEQGTKLSSIEVAIKTSQLTLETLQEQNRVIESQYQQVCIERDELNCRIQNGEEINEKLQCDLRKHLDIANNYKVELYEYEESNNKLNADAIILQEDLELLKSKLAEACDKIEQLQTLVQGLNHSIQLMKIKESQLLADVGNFKNLLDAQKKELKKFYQTQVEKVVQQKVNEFQIQLEAAEQALECEVDRRAHAIAEAAAKQIHAMVQHCEAEVHLLKEKHKEEKELNRLELTTVSQKMKLLQDQLHAYQNHRGLIAEKLHKVMETHWREALQIIRSPKISTLDNLENKMDKQDAKEMSVATGDEPTIAGDNKRQFPMKYVQFTDQHKEDTSKDLSTSQSAESNHLEMYIRLLLMESSRNESEQKPTKLLIHSTPKYADLTVSSPDTTALDVHPRSQKPPWK